MIFYILFKKIFPYCKGKKKPLLLKNMFFVCFDICVLKAFGVNFWVSSEAITQLLLSYKCF